MNSPRQHLILTLLFLTTTQTLHAQARFVADREIIKTGEIIYKQPRRITFPFVNRGDKPLTLTSVHPSCGCTKVEYPQTPIAPGQRGEIIATYDAAMLGTFSKHLHVYTDATTTPILLTMQGRVVATESQLIADAESRFPHDLGNVRMSTNYIEFDNVNRGDHPTCEFQVYNTERTAYRPQLMHLPPYLTAQYQPENIPGGKTGKILLTLDSDKVPSLGLNQTSVYLARYMGDKVGEDNEVNISAVLLPAFAALDATQMEQAPILELSQTDITIGNFGNKKEKTHTIKLRNNGKTTLEIKKIQVFNQGVGVALSNRTIKPGKEAKLKIIVSPKNLKRSKARPRVLLISNDPLHPIETINISVTN